MMFERSSGFSPPAEQRSAAFGWGSEARFTSPGFPAAGPRPGGAVGGAGVALGSRSPARAAELGAGLQRNPLAQPRDCRLGTTVLAELSWLRLKSNFYSWSGEGAMSKSSPR